ncbi:MAG: FHA domain-containing protein [Waddliaceae bacterium]
MIKFIINPEGEAKDESFSQEILTIGNGKEDGCDLIFPSVQEKHLQIIKENEQYYCINLIHDPFASINQLPFGKKRLAVNDRIEFGDEILKVVELEIQKVNHPDKKSSPVEEQPDPSPPIDELDDAEFDRLLKDLEDEDSKIVAEPPRKKEKPAPIFHQEKKPLPHAEKEPEKEKFQDWKLVIFLMLAICTICSSLLGFTYYWQSTQKADYFEMRVAGAVGDTSMAILFAKLNHISAPKQQWSNPDFINEQLKGVLAPMMDSLATFDQKGNFDRLPYFMRIYTSEDLARFLVIAQPQAGFFPFWSSSDAIVLDSSDMEIRRISNIRDLNRLLVHANPLEEKKGNEISQIIASQPRISLQEIGFNRKQWGFQTPQALSLLRPGAENKVYNAMRYYLLGESVLHKAASVFNSFHGVQDIAKIQDTIDDITDFPQLIFYSSNGVEWAREAQKAIDAFVPEKEIMIGYLKFDPKGVITGSHLLIDNEGINFPFDEIAQGRTDPNLIDPAKTQQLFAMRLRSSQSNISKLENAPYIDHSHPLYHRLKSLSATRERLLLPFKEEIFQTITRQAMQIQPNFDDHMQKKLKKFSSKDMEIRDTMKEQLKELIIEYPSVPMKELIAFTDSTGLSTLFKEAITKIERTESEIKLTEEKADLLLSDIPNSVELESLHENVMEISDMLTLAELPNFETLKKKQAQFQSLVLHQLKKLILDESKQLPKNLTLDHSRSLLIEILISSWVRDQQEFDYFLKEHDELYDESLGVPFHEG